MKCPRCGADNSPGAKFCVRCGGSLTGGMMAAAQTRQGESLPSSRFDLDKILFNQKKFSIVPQYYVFDERGNELFFVRRLFLALRRSVFVYTDKTMQKKILTVRQDRIIEIFNRHFTVLDEEGKMIGRFRRKNLVSILRRTWHILDAAGKKIGEAREDSWGKALFRRFGPLGEYFKTDFIIHVGGRLVGKFIRKWTVFDRYSFDLTFDPEKTFDRRLAVALGVLLDTAEGR
ncbi:MAG: zinc ribbon domain-containing protein [bacterium]